MRYYESQIALASITVVLFETIEQRPGHFLASLSDAVSGSLDALGRSVGGLIYARIVSLPWIVLAVVLWITVIRRVARKISFPLRLTVDPARE